MRIFAGSRSGLPIPARGVNQKPVGYRFEPQPEERIYVAAAASVGIRMITTPTSSDFDVRLTFREIG